MKDLQMEHGSRNPNSRPESISRREGILFVISAPSGAGKTSLCREIVDIFPDLRQSVSFTTRAPRSGEREGEDYRFVSREAFAEMVAQGAFAEWAEVHGNRYGTSLQTLETAGAEGIDLLLDIDCQGAAQIKANHGRGVFIFVLPPDLAELEKRLRGRNTDAPEVIEKRISNARQEIREAPWYDYVIINDQFPEAVSQLKAIITAERCRASRVLPGLAGKFQF